MTTTVQPTTAHAAAAAVAEGSIAVICSNSGSQWRFFFGQDVKRTSNRNEL